MFINLKLYSKYGQRFLLNNNNTYAYPYKLYFHNSFIFCISLCISSLSSLYLSFYYVDTRFRFKVYLLRLTINLFAKL